MVFLKANKRVRHVPCFLIIACCLLSFFSFTACGRRGDPVPVAPYKSVVGEGLKETGQSRIEEETEEHEPRVVMPDAPKGLMVLYTRKAVVITWDEIVGQDVRMYRVYRSLGDEHVFIGDTAAPAFTDRDVKSGTEYHYKVTAVGILESEPSEEIVIVTEVN
jgi:hypothetical protein